MSRHLTGTVVIATHNPGKLREMAELLAPLGYAATDDARDADMVILNTCHIRDKAAEKVFSELGRLRRLKEASGGRMVLAVAEGWRRGPSTAPVGSSAEVGPAVRSLLAEARPRTMFSEVS